MCIVALAWQVSGVWPVMLFSNRDEFFHRPTRALHQWPEGIIAAKDEEAGGTWLGITPAGKWAVLTNYRDPAGSQPAGERSRGLIVSEYLAGDKDAASFACQLNPADYRGYTLLLGDLNQAWVTGNRGEALKPLPPGVYVLSNAALGEPWPKVERLRQRVGQELLPLSVNAGQTEQLLAQAGTVLKDNQAAPEARLPQTGVPRLWEKLLSPIFVRSPLYGTTESSVVLMRPDKIVFDQTRFNVAGKRSHYREVHPKTG